MKNKVKNQGRVKQFTIGLISAVMAIALLLVGFNSPIVKSYAEESDAQISQRTLPDGQPLSVELLGADVFAILPNFKDEDIRSFEITLENLDGAWTDSCFFNPTLEDILSCRIDIRARMFRSIDLCASGQHSMPYGHYRIYYDMQYADVEIEDYNNVRSIKVDFNFAEPLPLPEAPTKEGHTFVGWYLDEALTIPYNGEPITEAMTFYAKFKINTYTVKFETGSGSDVMDKTVDYNTAVTLPNVTNLGFDFQGFFLPDGTQYIDQPIKADTILTAHWTIRTFTITFDSVGGEEIPSAIVNYAEPYTPKTPYKEGYTFLGWFIGNLPYNNQGFTASLTLTAHWEIKSYSVTFDSNGGAAVQSQTVEYGSNAIIPTIERVGYDFLGWFNGETKYEDKPITANLALTAKWQIKTFPVTFMADGKVLTSITVDYGTTFQAAMISANLEYNHLLNDKGAVISKSDKIVGAVTVPIGEMTTEEKIATFIGNNWWLLWTVGGLVVALSGALAIAIVIAKKRG